ncbi:hypothetical protein N9P17_08595 [Tateyamaria sp.]|nr:hypothetical protein [Tateyamaria sp.]
MIDCAIFFNGILLDYRSWRGRPESQRQREDMVILAHIQERHHRRLRRPCLTQELKEVDVSGRYRHARLLMRDNGIQAIRTRKYKATTDSNHGFNIAPIGNGRILSAISRHGKASYNWRS